jgi:hypothetical protein
MTFVSKYAGRSSADSAPPDVKRRPFPTLRDFGLMLAALARLASVYDPPLLLRR